MTWSASVYVGQTLMGQMELEGEFFKGHIRAPDSYAYFCPYCAKVWARVQVENQRFMVWSQCCWDCRENGHWLLAEPGSMMLYFEPAFNAALPRSIKLMEFNHAVECWEKRDALDHDRSSLDESRLGSSS